MKINQFLYLIVGLCLSIFACQTETSQKQHRQQDSTSQSAKATLNARKILDQANELMGKQAYKEAIELYNQSIEIAQNDSINAATAYHNKGLAFLYLKDTVQALKNYEKAMQLDKTYHSPYSSRGAIRLDRKDFRGALEDFNRASELNPQDELVFYQRGNAKFALKDKKGACEDWTKAFALGFSNAKYLIDQHCK
ncbi:MAG: tetratricopeptide repeat protein [Microscillaceae bacterium]|nr:tetratricopeptide repeat protein [Microscillaceae bacterium]MDW8461971.1 tetratricopeptide repeat protein [Cytophagales bacterium]